MGCSDDDNRSNRDVLAEAGILGRWEYADETINNISDMLPKCCSFFEFLPDENKNDFIGLFTYTDDQNENVEGVFVVDPTDQTIVFSFDEDEQLIYNYSINQTQDYLTFTFSEADLNYIQGWERRD